MMSSGLAHQVGKSLHEPSPSPILLAPRLLLAALLTSLPLSPGLTILPSLRLLLHTRHAPNTTHPFETPPHDHVIRYTMVMVSRRMVLMSDFNQCLSFVVLPDTRALHC